MRPNPFDLDDAVRAAHSDTPRSEAEARALVALRTRPVARRSRMFPRFAMITAATLAFLVLPLSSKSPSAAWAQVASATANEPRFHERLFYYAKGHPAGTTERWVDGRRFVWKFGTNKLRAMMGSDGRRLYQYFPTSGYVVAYQAGQMQREQGLQALGGITTLDIDQIVRSKTIRQIGEPTPQTTPEGPRVRYRLTAEGTKGEEVRVYTAPDDPRVLRWEVIGPHGEVGYYGVIDYPERIPDEVFRNLPPAGVKVFDMEVESARLRDMVAKGLGTQTVRGQPVTLRAVLADPRGNVTVLWTGTPPNGDLKPAVRIEGAKTVQAYGLSILTNKVYEYVPAVRTPDFLPSPLAGMSLLLRRPVRDRVDVTVPVFAPDRSRPVYDFEGRRTGYRSRFVGEAKFRGVPVLRPGPLYLYLNLLGLREPRPYEALVHEYRNKPRP